MAPAGTVPAQRDRALLVLTDLSSNAPRARKWWGRSDLIPKHRFSAVLYPRPATA